MGESGQVVLVPGIGAVKSLFEQRAHAFSKVDEHSTPYVYEVLIDAGAVAAGANLTESVYSPVPGGAQPVPDGVREGANGRTRRDEPGSRPTIAVLGEGGHRYGKTAASGKISVAMTASAHVGHLRFDFPAQADQSQAPYIFIQATRQNWTGNVSIDPETRGISGSNPQRQDYALGPYRAPSFRGYFVSRFSEPFASYGTTSADDLKDRTNNGSGEHLGAFVKFAPNTIRAEVRTGVSFVSIEQARRNLDIEAPYNLTFDDAVEDLKQAWLEKLGRVTIEGVNQTRPELDQRTTWYTGLFHALQYPSDFSEPLEQVQKGKRTWYEGYTDCVHVAEDSYYQSWSIWVRENPLWFASAVAACCVDITLGYLPRRTQPPHTLRA